MAGLESMSDLARLEEQLVNEYGELDAERFCSGNVLRVLQTGWGRRVAV
jgi:microsomal dipeptidase-like Zn-dependent dipeptidase